MNRKKILVFALGGALLVGSLTGCNTAAASQNKVSQPGTTSSQMSGTSTKITVAFAEGDDSSADVSYEELFQPYEQFGLTYDSDKNELQYKGAIRNSWSVSGTIDIYSVRDFANPNVDGYGTLTGIEKFSRVEFDEHTQSYK